MSRNEQWSTDAEIKQRFVDVADPTGGAGPNLKKVGRTILTDDSESHVEICGNTGMGKTQCLTLPLAKTIAQKRESGIFIDSNGDFLKAVGKDFECYGDQLFCLDFSDPYGSPTHWDPLKSPHVLYKSSDPRDNDTSSTQLNDFWNCVYPRDVNDEAFWTNAAANLGKGLTYGLFETASDEEINLDSIAVMMEQAEIRMGGAPLLKHFYDSLPTGSLARRNLATYVTGPNDTRGSIHSVASTGMEIFSRSRGLMEMLKNDTLDILNIDVSRPFAIFIILPQETESYDCLAGILVSQLMGHLMRSARKFKNNKLPIRVHCVLEELGSVGKALPDLHKWISQGRSKNIRLYLIVQSESQLEDVFGKNKADTIKSCIGITIGFSTNSWETLRNWSTRCGEVWTMKDGNQVKDSLIRDTALAAMPRGTALIMVDNQYKFISKLPFFYEMYENAPGHVPTRRSRYNRAKTFDFEEVVKKLRSQKMESILSSSPSIPSVDTEPRFPFSGDGPSRPFDLDGLVKRIDAKIAELEAEEEAEKKKQASKKTKKHVVSVIMGGPNSKALAEVIAQERDISVKEATDIIDDLPADFEFAKKADAKRFLDKVSGTGCLAIIHED